MSTFFLFIYFGGMPVVWKRFKDKSLINRLLELVIWPMYIGEALAEEFIKKG